MKTEVLADAAVAAERAAQFIAAEARDAVRTRGVFSLTVSGCNTPWPMLRALTAHDLQCGATVPVTDVNLEAAAARYAQRSQHIAGRPAVLDLVHLGLGDDGHTASLVPGDRVLSVSDADVALTAGTWVDAA